MFMQRRCSNCTKDDETFGPHLNVEADAGPVVLWQLVRLRVVRVVRVRVVVVTRLNI